MEVKVESIVVERWIMWCREMFVGGVGQKEKEAKVRRKARRDI